MGDGCLLRSGEYLLRNFFELLRGEIVWDLMIHDVADQVLDVIHPPIQRVLFGVDVYRASRTGDLVQHGGRDSDGKIGVQALLHGGVRRHSHIFFGSKLYIRIFRMFAYDELHPRCVELLVSVRDEFGHSSESGRVIDRGVMRQLQYDQIFFGPSRHVCATQPSRSVVRSYMFQQLRSGSLFVVERGGPFADPGRIKDVHTLLGEKALFHDYVGNTKLFT